MERIKIMLIVVLCIILAQSYAQLRYPTGAINVNTSPGGIVEEIKPLIEAEEITVYLTDNWWLGNVHFENGKKAKGYPLRYDIVNDQIEIKTSGIVRVAPGRMVQAFEVINPTTGQLRYFVRSNSFRQNKEIIKDGFFEVLNEGDINVLKYFDFTRIPANYNPALDVGSRTPTIETKEEFYLSQDFQISELPRKKRDFYELVDMTEKFKNLIKENGWSHKNEKELLKIIEAINNSH
ncbi:hypothetical protein E1176_01915 [Fulvivirga sp. RKSG066]|uniref:hypothetical protein n=1 Tax=Fulvivirga aurantia TaxID=2529383 RepID=UPI0012BCD3BC|nr:hypothetical protein [Fulvivirga aurantia]MTI19769.1 hypothetical protein [Fulvivirga aurantia]